MTTEQQLREKLRKITALFEGATTTGEREAAAAAIERIRQALRTASVKPEPPPEFKFTMQDQWQRRLFTALCRRYGIEPYRYRGQRMTTVQVRAPEIFINRTLWPEFLELQKAMHAYFNGITERIIRDEIYRDSGEAAQREPR